MGDRFYQEQLKTLGTCPGYIGKGKKRMAWDDDKKASAIKMYEESDPTPENSMEIVESIAEELNESPNGVRMILTKAGVYVKKGAAASGAKSSSSASSKESGTRVSKEAAHNRLIMAINDVGGEVDNELISKLTGKAALYFAGVLEAASK